MPTEKKSDATATRKPESPCSFKSPTTTSAATAPTSVKRRSVLRPKQKPPTVPVNKSSSTSSSTSLGKRPHFSPPPTRSPTRPNESPKTGLLPQASPPPTDIKAVAALRPACDSSHGKGCQSNHVVVPSNVSSVLSSRQSTATLHPLGRHSSLRKSPFVVVDYGATAEQGTRKTMEDQHTMLSEGIPFFGVYDGHGGTQCAEYLRDQLHGLILGHPEVKTNPEKAIVDGIVEADRAFLARSEAETNESGSVCAVALIIDDKLVVGNVGDAEVVLSHNAKPVVLTVRHNIASNPSEEERIRSVGGKVCHNRVGHPNYNPAVVSLAVTRAIGDAGFKLAKYTDGKPSGVIAVPETSVTRLTDEDEFLVIGCDGLWDVMTYAEVVDFCSQRFHEGVPAQYIAEELAQAALMKGSTDNVTAMLVHLTRREGPLSTREFVPEAAVSTSMRNLSEEP
ncbi:protein phosphatase 2c-like protein [Leishmania tarentolae]|uniref:Protein phosphatase 2c-like protein n=1 Tax=Leishmania tarentolae TaxID=5689 RepID=A0A640KTG4_LEITA|nr:protein phosphatase 2c-like protein [Leishmania tarentolae]